LSCCPWGWRIVSRISERESYGLRCLLNRLGQEPRIDQSRADESEGLRCSRVQPSPFLVNQLLRPSGCFPHDWLDRDRDKIISLGFTPPDIAPPAKAARYRRTTLPLRLRVRRRRPKIRGRGDRHGRGSQEAGPVAQPGCPNRSLVACILDPTRLDRFVGASFARSINPGNRAATK
jgi:hypothetical protein